MRQSRPLATSADELPDEPDPSTRGKRLRPQHQDEVRAKIQTSHLVVLLQKNAHGTLRNTKGELYELSPGRIKSAEILLAKSLSTLSATEVVSVNANDRMSESEILGKIAELLRNDPRLLQLVGSGRAVDGGPAVSDGPIGGPPDPDEPCVICGSFGVPGGCPACGADGADESSGPGAPGASDGSGRPV